MARATKDTCPVSGALAAVGTIEVDAQLCSRRAAAWGWPRDRLHLGFLRKAPAPPVWVQVGDFFCARCRRWTGLGLTLSVVVPATDQPATLGRCRAAILAADDPPEELIVIEEPARAGPAAARNAGAERATGSVLVFIDSDVIVRRDVFSRIRAAFEADPELMALFGSYDDSPSSHGVVSTFRNLLHHYMHQRYDGLASTFWAGLGAVRRDAFMAVGGFDAERFPVPSVEDIELGLRLHASGSRIELDPNIQGAHLKKWLLPPMVVTDFLQRGVPWIGLLLEHGPGAARLNASRRHRLSAACCACALGAAAARRRGLDGSADGGLPPAQYALLRAPLPSWRPAARDRRHRASHPSQRDRARGGADRGAHASRSTSPGRCGSPPFTHRPPLGAARGRARTALAEAYRTGPTGLRRATRPCPPPSPALHADTGEGVRLLASAASVAPTIRPSAPGEAELLATAAARSCRLASRFLTWPHT